MRTQPIYHLALRREWDEAVARGGPYDRSTIGRSLADEGFIHCSFEDQVASVARRFYDGEDVVLLTVDPTRVDADIVVENLDGGDERFPHVYGPLPLAAVVEARHYS